MTGLVMRNKIRGEIGLIKLERVQVACPACGQQVEAVASNGRVKGYCAVARQYVDFPVEPRDPVRADRDSKGHFVKGNVPWNKRATGLKG